MALRLLSAHAGAAAVWAACVTLALSGCVFALLFLPLSAIFAPSILENVWQRLHKKRAS